MESVQMLSFDTDDETEMPIFRNNLTLGKSKVVENIQHIRRLLERFCGLQLDPDKDHVFECSSVTFQGITYKCGHNNYLIFALSNTSGFPEFGRIKKIWYVMDYGLVFSLQVLMTVCYCEKLNAFEICEEQMAAGNEVINYQRLIDHHVYNAYKNSHDRSFIACRESILSWSS